MSASFEITKQVLCSDTGADGKMTIGAIFNFLSDCELLQINSCPHMDSFLKKNNYALFLSARGAEILRVPSYGETVRVHTSVYSLTPMTGYRNTYIYDESGKAVVKTNGFGVLVDTAKGRLARSDELIKSGYQLAECLGMQPLERRIDIPLTGGHKADTIVVPRDYIDINRHVNNAKYIAAAAEFLPDDFAIKQIRAEYKNAAIYKDSMDIYVYPAENTVVVELKNNSKVFCIVEFVK